MVSVHAPWRVPRVVRNAAGGIVAVSFAATVLIFLTTPASADVRYTVTDLGTLGGALTTAARSSAGAPVHRARFTASCSRPCPSRPRSVCSG